MRWLLIALALIVFAASLILANYIQNLPTLQFAVPSPEEVGQLSLSTILLQALCLFIGIFFGYAHKRLSDLRSQGVQEIDVRVEIRSFFRSINFWIALTAAPMVFGVVVALSGGLPVGTGLFLAFQNGFFWERVMPEKPMDLQKPPHSA